MDREAFSDGCEGAWAVKLGICDAVKPTREGLWGRSSSSSPGKGLPGDGASGSTEGPRAWSPRADSCTPEPALPP